MSKGTRPIYYRKSLLVQGMLPRDQTCPFADKCDHESCSARVTPVDFDWHCPAASALNHAYRVEVPQNPKVTDKRGREWERFCDESYYGITCIRCLAVDGARDFDSMLSFHLNPTDADAFWDMLPRLS